MKDQILQQVENGQRLLQYGYVSNAAEVFKNTIIFCTADPNLLLVLHETIDVYLFIMQTFNLFVNQLYQHTKAQQFFEQLDTFFCQHEHVNFIAQRHSNVFWKISEAFIEVSKGELEHAYHKMRTCYRIAKQVTDDSKLSTYVTFLLRNVFQIVKSMIIWPVELGQHIYEDIFELFDITDQGFLIDPQKFHGVITRFFKSSHFKSLQHLLLQIHNEAYDLDLEKMWEFVPSALLNNNLLHTALKHIYFCDIHMEILFTVVRKYLLLHPNIKDKELFEKALMEQCKLNEYVYFVSEEEKQHLDSISAQQYPFTPIQQCYFLSQQQQQQHEKRPQSLRFTESIAQRVKQQYEDNPYPLWKNLHFEPIFLENNITENPNILIVGCGTGRQAIFRAKCQPNASIVAFDISKNSIGYAQRMATKFHVNHKIKFHVLDLFDLPKYPTWKKKFDVIECTGVLHHIEETQKALAILKKCLTDTGQIYLALYSASARQTLPNQPFQGIRHLQNTRKKLMEQTLQKKGIIQTPDFYTTSTCRDILFHEFEKRFTIPEILKLLAKTNLVFRRFLVKSIQPHLLAKYIELYGDQDPSFSMTTLWEQFENTHPETFQNMYHFLVSQ